MPFTSSGGSSPVVRRIVSGWHTGCFSRKSYRKSKPRKPRRTKAGGGRGRGGANKSGGRSGRAAPESAPEIAYHYRLLRSWPACACRPLPPARAHRRVSSRLAARPKPPPSPMDVPPSPPVQHAPPPLSHVPYPAAWQAGYMNRAYQIAAWCRAACGFSSLSPCG